MLELFNQESMALLTFDSDGSAYAQCVLRVSNGLTPRNCDVSMVHCEQTW